MKYQHRFNVKSSLSDVTKFHRHSHSMGAITPPPLQVNVLRAPETLVEGDEMEFTLGLGPIAIPWLARIKDVTETGFIDEQVSGPFQSWEHQHSFVATGEANTDVIDKVEAKLQRHPIWGPVGLFMWLNLPILFAYRGWRTRQLLSVPQAFPSKSIFVAVTVGAALAVALLAWRFLKRNPEEQVN